MSLRVSLLSLVVIGCALPAPAQNVSLFVSGIRTDRTAELLSDQPDRKVRSREGALGIALEHRAGPMTTIELSAEDRRDVVSSLLASRCGPNTCFKTHRFAIRSTPIVLLARVSAPAGNRLALFGSLGARYVAKPSAQDLTHASLFVFETKQRISAEAGAGIAWHVMRRLSLFAEGRILTRAGAQWDPRRRVNLGMKMRF